MHQDTLKFYKYVPTKKPIYKGKFCREPFEIIQIDKDGDVQLCSCQLHMPYTIGNIYKSSMQEIWLGESADRVRQAVIDEDFTYCNWACNKLPILPPRPETIPAVADFPKVIKIDMDLSCNLHCPSCRENPIIEKNSEKIKNQVKIFEEIKSWAVQNPQRTITVIPMASGEIFASPSGIQFLYSLSNMTTTNLKLKITTNGTLINRNQDLLYKIRNQIQQFSISIDASTPETYALVRGGDWQELQKGLEFVRDKIKLPMAFSFCIQKNNWHEIEEFAEYANLFNANIGYQKLLDWGHWTIDWWHDNNVFDRKKSSFTLALKSLSNVRHKYPRKIITSAELTKYLEKQNL